MSVPNLQFKHLGGLPSQRHVLMFVVIAATPGLIVANSCGSDNSRRRHLNFHMVTSGLGSMVQAMKRCEHLQENAKRRYTLKTARKVGIGKE